MKTYIIGEPGSTHGGDWWKMLELIAIAKAAGCDAVKWQWISSAEALAQRRNALDYAHHYQAIEFRRQTLASLMMATREAGLDALCTVYLPEDVPIVVPLVDKVKIASFEASDLLLRKLVAAYGKPTLISTGMMNERDVDLLLSVDSRALFSYDTILHCVSSYPAPIEALNLSVIRRWTEKYWQDRVGWSDHSADVETGALAVAAGAQVVEVHYRHHATPESNADYATALMPGELREYVRRIRRAEIALGSAEKTVQPAERPMQAYLAAERA